ncbi:MAG TPA: TauD/TfdA family dioxygenase [Thermoanaerobaculia bacterium]|jgi:alpha-ketoglutarate-dependent taurine dioxygenase
MSQTTRDFRWEIPERLPVISGDGRPQVSEAEAQIAEQLMESTGVVLFRDFNISVDDFRELTKRLGSSFSDEKWAPHALSRRGPRIGLHTEQAFVPAIPSAVWFYSAKPAERGGATIICDGAEVVSQLSPASRRFWEENEVLYWHRFSGKPPEPFRRLLKDPPELGRNYRDHELTVHDDFYETTSLCRPLIYSRVGRRPVFGNHILNTIQHDGQDEPPEIDGFHQARLPTREQFPRELIDELVGITSRLCLKCKLGQNEMVWIDNTRFLHGRDPFEGSRQMLALKAFYADQWPPGYNPADFTSHTVGAPTASR